MTSCFAVCALAIVTAVLTGVLASRSDRLPRETRFALGTSIVGALPGLVFVLQLLPPWARGSLRNVGDLISFWPAVAWILVGPFVFLRSAILAKPFGIAKSLDALRLLLWQDGQHRRSW